MADQVKDVNAESGQGSLPSATVEDDFVVLECGGIDWKRAQAFRSAVAALPTYGGVILDLRGGRSDAAGTGAIICAVLDLTDRSQPVVLLTGAGLERHVLESTGLGQFAAIVSSLDEARHVLLAAS